MNRITRSLYKWQLPIILSNKSPNIIPRSGEEGEKVNCYTVYLNNNLEPFLLVNNMDGDDIVGLEWDGNKYTLEKRMKISSISEHQISIRHYYGLATITYDSVYDYLLHKITKWIYIKLYIRTKIESIDQYFFNKTKLITKQRIELLKFMMTRQLDDAEARAGVSSFELMRHRYSIKWVLHPEGERYKRELELYLDSLVKSGDLENNDHSYVVTGKAISTIEKYEEEERRHTENVKIQRGMLWLTLFIFLLTIIQAGLVKLPTLIDISKIKP